MSRWRLSVIVREPFAAFTDMVQNADNLSVKEHRLGLVEVVDALLADGLVMAADGEPFRKERRYFRGDAHPLSVIAAEKWKSAKPPHGLFDAGCADAVAGRLGSS